MAPRVVALYDSDCGLCTFFARAIGLLDVRSGIDWVPLSSRHADAWFAGASEDERFGSFHVVRGSGERLSRGRALIALLEALPVWAGLARLLFVIPAAVEAAERVYGLAVRYREFLGGTPTRRGATSAPSGSS